LRFCRVVATLIAFAPGYAETQAQMRARVANELIAQHAKDVQQQCDLGYVRSVAKPSVLMIK